MNTEKELKAQLIKSAESVRRKVKQMRAIEFDSNNAIETVLKPITDPLQKIASRNEENQITPVKKLELKRVIKRENELLSPNYYFNRSIKPATSQETISDILEHDKAISDDMESDNKEEEEDEENEDKNASKLSFKSIDSDDQSWPLSTEVFNDAPYGARLDRGKLKIGNLRLKVTGDTFIIGGLSLQKTPGLYELLFKKTPNLEEITDSDLVNYKLVLLETNAHRRDFSPKKPIKSNKGAKYLNIIKPLFRHSKDYNSTESLVKGSGISLLKRVKPNTDFVYWDDPNELVERLKLLIASRDAGNTGLDNEIISIIEELREADVIN